RQGTPQKRLIGHIRNTFYRNDLSGALPSKFLESRALSHQNYQLAYTPEMIADIFGTKVSAGMLTEGGFIYDVQGAGWWVPSGMMQYIQLSERAADAQNRFYSPVAYTDPFGGVTKIRYEGDYFLFIKEIEDVLGNKNS